MSGSRRVELFLGVGAVLYGLLLLFVVYLQPYGDSKFPEQWVTLHPGWPESSPPYILAFGLPILGIAIGAIIDAAHPNPVARVLLWLATAVFLVETGLTMASIGLFLLPAFVAGFCASLLAFTESRPTPQRAGG
ncbi:MAG TPA: hypothetical protein VFW76_12400 [Ktedonobacterales bacterium]|nr:hypothetical protein [Ktedonobacterales bacterium]